jgi:hypothetical protein
MSRLVSLVTAGAILIAGLVLFAPTTQAPPSRRA